jgi:hypothetical protein
MEMQGKIDIYSEREDLTYAAEIECKSCGYTEEFGFTASEPLPYRMAECDCGSRSFRVEMHLSPSSSDAPEPATLDCGHPDCDTSLSMTGEELVETQAWKNGMGRGCAVEEIREKSGWTGDGWHVFCPSHDDWADL